MVSRRPLAPTAGAVLSLILTGIALAFGGIRTTGVLSYGPAVAQAVMLVAIGVTVVGFIGSIRALQNSNAGRLTAATLGITAAVIAGLIFLGTLTSQTAPNPDDRAPQAVVLISAAWAFTSTASALLLLTKRSDAWYVRRWRTAGVVSGPGAAAPGHPRATTVVVLGVLALVTTFLTGILGPVLGVLAWSMASSELREIRMSGARYADEGSLHAGRLMGIIATALSLILLAAIVVAVVLIGVHPQHQPAPGPTGVDVLPARIL
ncbi:hypothetical protein Back2_05430 [Nocardioides baekrokdamisoli]|uniref:DUF4190 domain-containing protein n=1 Tax=Nocardioides baekrokdamisoli TaxID=1804624 RepID=A0A3G9ID21_9ACTN|nr:hypothetical protein Back2_05430 [Nocardioides baekrokdamisoli]